MWKSPEQVATEQAKAEREERYTFGQYVADWQAVFNANPRKAQKTKDNYDSVLRNHLLPTFADVPLKALDRERIILWAREPYTAPKSRIRAFETLRKILNDAAEDGCLGASPITPRLTERVLAMFGKYRNEDDYANNVEEKHKALSARQVAPFLDSMAPEYRLLAEVLIHSGMRSGEARALRGTDATVHLDKAVTLTVSKAVKESQGKGRYEGATKTRNTRSLTLTGELGRRLAARIEALEDPAHLIFPKPGTDDAYLSERTLLENCQRAGTGHAQDKRTPLAKRRRVCEGIGREVTVHQLRNTYAAIARAAGIDHSQRQYQLGHKPKDMTEFYEGGTQLEEQRAMADKFTAYLASHGGAPAEVVSMNKRRHHTA
ncbi:tyrosine-type recombinase/integrase [Trueperella bernardiae]|uniref:tyrosine-type recombinase/integrase n=1 Tax=Trueperella bernardiae TaxID=59561 RepID=UPI002948D524|nr:tyrosine-type recombinase/integrase [Trueperella bernardiae]MDV6239388.1 tyrosine-type recombinase/integrase [Trueperella bernardiae]